MSHALSHLSGDEYRDRTGTIHASLLKEKLNGTFKAEAETAKIKLPKGFIPEFEMRPSAPAQLVKKTLPLRGTGLGIGQSGAGKTVVFLDLACATATGEPFFGREVRNQGGVVYIAVEGAGGFSNRVKAAKIHRGINGAIPLVVKAGAYNLKNDNELDPLIRELQQASAWFQQEYGVPLRLTIIDTMSAACALQNENDNAEVADVCKRLQRIDAETGAFPVLASIMQGKTQTRALAALLRGARTSITSLQAPQIATRRLGSARTAAFSFRNIGRAGRHYRRVRVQVYQPWSGRGRGEVRRARHCPDRLNIRKVAQETDEGSKIFDTAFDEAALDHSEKIRVHGDGPEVMAVDVQHVRCEFFKRYGTGEVDKDKRHEATRKAFKRSLQDIAGRYALEATEAGERIWRI